VLRSNATILFRSTTRDKQETKEGARGGLNRFLAAGGVRQANHRAPSHFDASRRPLLLSKQLTGRDVAALCCCNRLYYSTSSSLVRPSLGAALLLQASFRLCAAAALVLLYFSVVEPAIDGTMFNVVQCTFVCNTTARSKSVQHGSFPISNARKVESVSVQYFTYCNFFRR